MLPSSNFLRTGQPDPRLAQSAGTPFDATARQVLDQQVVDVQTLLSLLHANGVVGSYVQIDPASPVDVEKGDVICRSSEVAKTTALVATAANLAAAGGSVMGIALDAVPKGSRCPYAVLGAIPPEVTGLVAGLGVPGLSRVSAAGRVQGVFAYGDGDTPLGGVDANGWLTLSPGGLSPALSNGIFRGSLTTLDATPASILTVPFSDDAVLTGSLLFVALTPPVGGDYLQSARYGITLATVGGVLQAPIGSPITITSTTYPGPSFPSFAFSYASNLLSLDVTGLAATDVRWVARVDALTLLL